MLDIWVLTIGKGFVPLLYEVDETQSIKELKKVLALFKCGASAVRLYQVRWRISTAAEHHTSESKYDDWMGVDDAEVSHLKRIDFFEEVVGKLPPPELEMQDGRPLSEYLNVKTLWCRDLKQLHVLMKVTPESLRVFCRETNRTVRREFPVEKRLERRMRENRTEGGERGPDLRHGGLRTGEL